MNLKESLEVFEIEERRGGSFRIIKQPYIDFRAFQTSCGWYIITCLYPEFVINEDSIKIYLRGTMEAGDLRWFTVPAQHIKNFKQSIKEFVKR